MRIIEREDRIRIGIAGYGNLGRGVETALAQMPDMALAAIFTRRAPESLQTASPGVPVLPLSEAAARRDAIDVMAVCGGSATDLPVMTPLLAENFCCVDSFDTHAQTEKHYGAVDAAARAGGTVAVISAGWDPGLFSLARLLGAAALPAGESCTFWGRGVSQGHSDALRRIPGVLDARQYTVPLPEKLAAAQRGEGLSLPVQTRHRRECYVVAEEGADQAAIERAIVMMPDYFAGYDTAVRFVTAAELSRNHSGLPHGGTVHRSGTTGTGHRHSIQFSLKLDSNPEFTAGVLLAYARAAFRLARRGESGCRTPLDVSLALLSPLSPKEQRATFL